MAIDPLSSVKDFIEPDLVPSPVYLLGCRGFMGPGNQVDLYDDRIFLIEGKSILKEFKSNTDPSHYHPQVAILTPGIWSYKWGIHGLSKPKEKQYEALVQAAPVIVQRWGGVQEQGLFGINIHCGSKFSTSSEGCQTIHPEDWVEFFSCVKERMQVHSRSSISYVLTEEIKCSAQKSA